MPKLSETSIELRKHQAIQVYIQVSKGSSLKDALEKTGISQDVYYHWIQTCDDALEALHELSSSIERQHLSDMVIAKNQIVKKLITKIDSDKLDVKELIDIYRLFGVEIEALTSRHTIAVQDVIDFLSGPETRIIPQGTNIKVKEDGSIDVTPIPPDIIDA